MLGLFFHSLLHPHHGMHQLRWTASPLAMVSALRFVCSDHIAGSAACHCQNPMLFEIQGCRYRVVDDMTLQVGHDMWVVCHHCLAQ